jgi:steryl-sulfatase/arylsulfatase D/F/H
VETAVVSMMDIFATVVELAGGTMPSTKVMDGKSLVPLLTSHAGGGVGAFGALSIGGSNSSASPHEALFHYCGDTLMAVRYKQWKLRFYTEQLPFANYSTQHCTNGWAHGEFFQGGWGCHGGAVTTNDPPELMDIESDPQERCVLGIRQRRVAGVDARVVGRRTKGSMRDAREGRPRGRILH